MAETTSLLTIIAVNGCRILVLVEAVTVTGMNFREVISFARNIGWSRRGAFSPTTRPASTEQAPRPWSLPKRPITRTLPNIVILNNVTNFILVDTSNGSLCS